MRPLLACLAAVLATVALVACGEKAEPEPVTPTAPAGAGNGGATTGAQTDGDGGGGGGGQATPEEEVESAVAAVLGGGDPAAACSELVTAGYVKAAYGDEQGCRQGVAQQGTIEVAVSDVQIQGATATAKAKPAAGPNKGETIKVELVNESGTWKVDSTVSNAPAGP